MEDCLNQHIYRSWGEVLEIDTWVGASGKNGMRRDWLIRSHLNGQIYARGTSTWLMMNRRTRCLSKMPEEVRGEISPWFLERQVIQDDVAEKIIKLDENAAYVYSDLKPKSSDLDMNHHVNNVKYVKWMLETIPEEYLETHQLSSIVLEYRIECGSSDIVQSLCEPDEDLIDEEEKPLSTPLASTPATSRQGWTNMLLTKRVLKRDKYSLQSTGLTYMNMHVILT